jgi:hypothetical protein
MHVAAMTTTLPSGTSRGLFKSCPDDLGLLVRYVRTCVWLCANIAGDRSCYWVSHVRYAAVV